MKKITLWASRNTLLSWIIITVGLITLYFLGFMWGMILSDEVSAFNSFWIIVGILAIVLMVIQVYPDKKQRREIRKAKKEIFRHWKVYDLTMVLMVVALVMHFGCDTEQVKLSENRSVEVITDIVSFVPLANVANSTIDHSRKNRILKWVDTLQIKWNKKVRAFISKHYSKKGIFGKILLFLFGGVITYVLSIGLAFLYCNLACGGYTVLSIVALVLGILLIVSLLFWSAKGFIKSQNKRNGSSGEESDLNKQSFLLSLYTILTLLAAFFIQLAFA